MSSGATTSILPETIHSDAVGDAFRLDIRVPEGPGPFPLLLYLDAHLPSGRKVPLWMRAKDALPPLVSVGIGQVGSYFRKRNRDFIPQPLHKREKTSYGRAADFYQFLTTELLPRLRGELPLSSHTTLLGHSLGGLFVLYALLQTDHPFTGAISLSPSVWINRRNVLKLAEMERDAGQMQRGRLYMACGDLERFNFILPGMRAYEDWLRSRAEPELELKVEALPWKTHFSVVRPGVLQGLEWVYGGK